MRLVVRHPAGRSGEPGARRDRREAPRARARASTSSSSSTDSAVAGRPPGELRRAPLPLVDARGPRAALRVGARARARAVAAPDRGRRAHVPDLRGARGAARPAARRRRAALVHALASEPAAAGSPSGVSTAVITVDARTFPLAVGQGRRRSGTGSTSPTSRASSVPARDGRCGSSRSAARRRRRGSTRSCARSRSFPGRELTVTGPSLTEEERAHRAALEALVAELGVGDRVRIDDAVPRERVPALLAGADALVNNMRAGRDRQGRLRGRRDLPARARLEPGARRAAPARAPLRPRRSRTRSPSGSGARRRPTGRALGRAPARGRRARARRRRVGGARRRDRVGRSTVSERRAARRPRSPASRARRTTCSLLLPGSARARLGRPLPPAPRGRAGCLGARRRASTTQGSPVEGVRLPRAADPLAFSPHPARGPAPARRRSSTPTSCTPTSTGSPPAASRGCRCSSSTKHGFNPFRASRAFAAGDRAVGALADVHIAISAGLARYLERDGGLRTRHVRDRPLRDRATAPSRRPPPGGAAARDRRAADPDQGARRPARRARASRRVPELSLEIAGDGPLRAALEARRSPAAGSATASRFLGRVAPADAGARARRRRRRALARRGLRHGRARGDGARTRRDRERGRRACPRSSRTGVTGLLVPAHDPDALAAAIRELATDPARCAAMGARRPRARARRVLAGALHRADRGALPRGARLGGLASSTLAQEASRRARARTPRAVRAGSPTGAR